MPDTYKNIFDFAKKRVVVTGGAGMLGAEIVKCFSEFKASIIVADNNAERGKSLIEKIKNNGGDISFSKFDQSQIEKIPSFINELEERYGTVNVWINNAYPRTEDWGNDLDHMSISSWRKNVDMHLNGYCICSNEIAKRMASRGGGVIINIGSIQSLVAPDFTVYEGTDLTSPAAYTAIKSGILGYSKYLASYFGRKNVRVNVVCPGGMFNNQPKDFIEKYKKRTLLGRMAEAADIAPAVMFLASNAATYVTGTVLTIDGGLTSI